MPYIDQTMLATECRVASTGFTPATTPTDAKVDEIIAEVEAEIDAIVGSKYGLPLVGAGNLLIMRGISLALCAFRVKSISPGQSYEPEKDPFRANAREARAKLLAIVKGEMVLSGENPAVSGDGVRSYAVQSGCQPVFRRGVDQW